MKTLQQYEVGFPSDKRLVYAPSATSAALYYGLVCDVSPQQLFLTYVYKENDSEMEIQPLFHYSKEKGSRLESISAEFVIGMYQDLPYCRGCEKK